ncbi:para-nitrobenzyl esterase-like [Sycon ciliatum]|uniref:para-nitrobenzyl esterase-like n=1 Tax=Sycon ciliatum TaxID=27933 RepID=UPI0031F692EE
MLCRVTCFSMISVAIASILLLAVGPMSVANALDMNSVAPPVAVTNCGPMKGTWEDGVAVFRGIPYAKPPTGDRRWRPSLKLEKNSGCWEGTLDATKFGNVCMQLQTPDGSTKIGNEDCLYINVMTSQRTFDAQQPVAVWIHGGYLMFGSGGEPAGYAPNPAFTNNTGVVAVSFNYRLNAFGFLSLGVLDKGRGSGNYGFYDQILALKWIQENIAAFGGDKDRVTVYGQSSGGTSIVALLSSPMSVGCLAVLS